MKPRFLTDENIDLDLILALRRRLDGIDVVRVQEVGIRTMGDPAILQWAADEGRILISHDLKAIPGFAGERLTAGLLMPGVVLVRGSLALGRAIEELATLAGATDAAEWNSRIVRLPLR